MYSGCRRRGGQEAAAQHGPLGQRPGRVVSRYSPAASGTIAAVTSDANGTIQVTTLTARPPAAGAAGALPLVSFAGAGGVTGGVTGATRRARPDAQHRDHREQHEQPGEDRALGAERAAPASQWLPSGAPSRLCVSSVLGAPPTDGDGTAGT